MCVAWLVRVGSCSAHVIRARLESCLAAHCRKWLDAHLKDQWYLGKPVVIEEFGKAVGARSSFSHLYLLPPSSFKV